MTDVHGNLGIRIKSISTATNTHRGELPHSILRQKTATNTTTFDC
jgi:hypothetical protein